MIVHELPSGGDAAIYLWGYGSYSSRTRDLHLSNTSEYRQEKGAGRWICIRHSCKGAVMNALEAEADPEKRPGR